VTIKTVKHVDAAEIIRSSLFNDLIDNIADLQNQIDGLGTPSTTTTQITSLDPAGDVQEETELDVHGRNFAVPVGLNTVTLDGKPIEAFLPGSTDTLLRFDVPGGIPGLPKTMTLVVSANGSDSRAVHVVPSPVSVGGRILFTDKTGDLGTIAVNTSYVFQFELDGSNLSIAETFRVRARYSGAIGGTTADWDAATTYLGPTGANHEVVVAPNARVNVGVAVKVPASAQSVQFHVEFVSVHNDPSSSNSTGSIPIVVGESQGAESGAVSFTFGQSASADLVFGPIGNENGASVTHGKSPLVTLNATYNIGGTYDYARVFEFADGTPDAASPWTADQPVASTQAHPAGATEQVKFKLTAPGNSPADGKQRYLRVTATRRETDPPGPVSSYHRFPIQVL
jgi:hypothetical protein